MKHFYIFIIVVLLYSSSPDLLSQKQFNNWYFGYGTGITFNTPTGDPESLNDCVLNTWEGCSTISDIYGNLLFFTDGVSVWNRQHKIMKNGESLFGNSSSSQSAIIVQKPGYSNLYYIFTTDYDPTYQKDRFKSKGFNYSIVDISLESGMGSVIEKNIHLLDTTSERLSAVGHKNGKDVWIVTQDIKTKSFASYLLTEYGLVNHPVFSPCSGDFDLWQGGSIKFSPNGKKLALTFHAFDYDGPNIYSYDFDSNTGKLSNEISLKIQANPYGPYGIEFSDLGQFLYVSSVKDTNMYIHQYDITYSNSLEISNSQKLIYYTVINNYEGYYFGALQMGPNKKIYLTCDHSLYLSFINQPDLLGDDCDFRYEAIYLNGNRSALGLPAFVQNYNSEVRRRNISACEGDSIFLFTDYFFEAKYEWTGPLGFTSSVQNPVITNTKPEMSGKYYSKISKNGNQIFTDSAVITINPRAKILFADISELNIYSNSYDLKALDNPIGQIITWSGINSNENVLTITKNGKYKVVVENPFGCIDSAEININIFPGYCEGDTIFLSSGKIKNAKYFLWTGPGNFNSTEENPVIPNFNANMSGEYSVRIITIGSFEGEIDTIYKKYLVILNQRSKILFSNIKELLMCQDSLELQAVDNPEGYKIKWKGINSTDNKVVIKNTGIYSVYVENESGCIDSATIEIKNYNAELVSDPEYLTFNELCIGSSDTKNIQFTLKSDYDLAISAIYFKSNIFSIDNINNYLKSYKDGETFELPITFKPLDADMFYDTLVIESGEPCHYKKSIPIYGTSKALFQFSLPNIISQAGNYLMIPIYAGMTCPNSDKLSADYEIEISFDKEYFIPDSVKFGAILENKLENQNRLIIIKGTTEFNEKKDTLFPINYIYGLALVGRKEIVPLTIDSVNFTNKRYYPEYINGSLKIEGCVNNIRPIQLFKPTKLSIAPNPTDGDIKLSIETQEKGTFKIEIFNLQGQSIYKKEFSKSNSSFEEFDYFYDTKEMGSGVYSVHLTSPWNIIRKQLVISK